MMNFLISTASVSCAISIAITAFMYLLYRTIDIYQAHWQIFVLFLPLAGLALFAVQKFRVIRSIGDSESILEEIRNPQKLISPWLAPFILVTTLWSHLFGAAVGRESTAIQIGASLADGVGALLHKYARIPQDRAFLLRLGLAAGFSAAFGTPVAGFIFGLEHPQHFTKFMFRNAFWVLLGSFISFAVSKALGIVHFAWPPITLSANSWSIQFLVLAFALGLATVAYEFVFHALKKFFAKWPASLALFSAGAVITIATYYFASPRYNGLGTELTKQAFEAALPWADFLTKSFFLLLSTASGFKGGEVTPLISLSATFASAMTGTPWMVAAAIPVFFAYRLRCPLAGFVILIEYFNLQIAILGAIPLAATWLIHELLRWRKSSGLTRYF